MLVAITPRTISIRFFCFLRMLFLMAGMAQGDQIIRIIRQVRPHIGVLDVVYLCRFCKFPISSADPTLISVATHDLPPEVLPSGSVVIKCHSQIVERHRLEPMTLERK